MKRTLILLPAVGLMLSCSGGVDKPAETDDYSQEQIEAIEQSSQDLDAIMESSGAMIDTLQSEIDELLSDI